MKDITSTFAFANNFENLTEKELFKTIGGKRLDYTAGYLCGCFCKALLRSEGF